MGWVFVTSQRSWRAHVRLAIVPGPLPISRVPLSQSMSFLTIISSTRHNALRVHPRCHKEQDCSFWWLSSIPWRIDTFYLSAHLSMDTWVGVLAVVNNAAVNMRSLRDSDFISFGHGPRSGVAGPSGSSFYF